MSPSLRKFGRAVQVGQVRIDVAVSRGGNAALVPPGQGVKRKVWTGALSASRPPIEGQRSQTFTPSTGISQRLSTGAPASRYFMTVSWASRASR
jgi:hypothetical protein